MFRKRTIMLMAAIISAVRLEKALINSEARLNSKQKESESKMLSELPWARQKH